LLTKENQSSLLSIHTTRAKFVEYERDGYILKIKVSRWFDLAVAADVKALHHFLVCRDAAAASVASEVR
jgi:hypothetical protein